MSDTVTATDDATMTGGVVSEEHPALTIVFHPDPAFIGERYAWRDEQPVELGRTSTQFDGALEIKQLSRRHLQITRRGDHLEARDLGSRNGSLVNGDRIDHARLRDGDIVGLGRILLLVHRGPAFFRRPRHPVLIGVSHALATITQRVKLVDADTTVLIQGESGVGKELICEQLHAASGRKGELVSVNCGAVSDGVLQSTFFGHLKGAFSGADRNRPGLVRAADGGTLFLDEIGDASPTLQTSLLRLLEQREFRPVGSDEIHHANARFVAASHVRLAEAVEAGTFRNDLFNRVCRWVIEIPPLRARPEDIVPLALHFADGMPLSRSLALALLRYRWPGNVRELQSVIRQAVMEETEERLTLTPMLEKRLSPTAATSAAAEDAIEPTVRPERLTASELRRRLAAHQGNMSALAHELGIGRSTLYRWFRKLDIDPREL